MNFKDVPIFKELKLLVIDLTTFVILLLGEYVDIVLILKKPLAIELDQVNFLWKQHLLQGLLAKMAPT